MMTAPLVRLETIQSLRGIAASMVVVAHFGTGRDFVAAFPTLGTIASYGTLGVPIFFVISGFVIPYSRAVVRSGKAGTCLGQADCRPAMN